MDWDEFFKSLGAFMILLGIFIVLLIKFAQVIL